MDIATRISRVEMLAHEMLRECAYLRKAGGNGTIPAARKGKNKEAIEKAIMNRKKHLARNSAK